MKILSNTLKNHGINIIVTVSITLLAGFFLFKWEKCSNDRVDLKTEENKAYFFIDDIKIISTDSMPELQINISNNKAKTVSIDSIVIETVYKLFVSFTKSGYSVLPDRKYDVYLSNVGGKTIIDVNRAIKEKDMDNIFLTLNGDYNPQEGLNMYLIKVGIIKKGKETYFNKYLLVNIPNGRNALRSTHEEMPVVPKFITYIDTFLNLLPKQTKIESRLLFKLNTEKSSLKNLDDTIQ